MLGSGGRVCRRSNGGRRPALAAAVAPAEILAVTRDDCVAAVIDSADQAGFTRFGRACRAFARRRHDHRDRLPPSRPGSRAGLCRRTRSLRRGPALPPSSSGATCLRGAAPGADRRTRQDVLRQRHERRAVGGGVAAVRSRVRDLVECAGLSGYPADVPMTFVSLTDDVGVPPELARQMIVNLGWAGRSQGVIGRPPGDGDEAGRVS